MTTTDPSPPAGDDAAISAAVEQLLEQRRETVVDLAHFTRISVSSLYRKLAGQQSWKASDVGSIARHYEIDPGRLFGPAGAAGRPAAPVPRSTAAPDYLHPFSGRV